MEKAEADAALAKLSRAERAHNRNQDALAKTIASCDQRINALTILSGQITNAIRRGTDTRGDAIIGSGSGDPSLAPLPSARSRS